MLVDATACAEGTSTRDTQLTWTAWRLVRRVDRPRHRQPIPIDVAFSVDAPERA